ncbi:MAG: hypothetical protein M3Q42_08790 [Pseudomonadota bacterium]|nr:hypothetical protein [Pseudomonadota bacterium]
MTTLATSWISSQWETTTAAAIAAVVVMLVAQRASARMGMWPYALFSLPGTLAHEFAHFATAVLLLASPRFPQVWPVRTEDGWRLGSVTFSAGMLRAVPIAMAPLVLLPISLYWSAEWVSSSAGWRFWAHAWFAATLLNGSLPSRADFNLTFPALFVAVVLVLGTLVFFSQ